MKYRSCLAWNRVFLPGNSSVRLATQLKALWKFNLRLFAWPGHYVHRERPVACSSSIFEKFKVSICHLCPQRLAVANNVAFDVLTDERDVSCRNSSTGNKVLGSGYGWLEAAAEHSTAQVVLACNWQRCYERIRPSCSYLEHAHQDLWILPKQVRTWYLNSLIMI